METIIRQGTKKDIPALHSLINQLAVYEKVTNSAPPRELVEPLSYALYETAKKCRV